MTLLELGPIAKVNDYKDWVLSGPGSTRYWSDVQAIRLFNQGASDQTLTTSISLFVEGSQPFDFFNVSVTGGGYLLDNAKELCVFEVSVDGGATWLAPPIIEQSSLNDMKSRNIDQFVTANQVVSAEGGNNKGLALRLRVVGAGNFDHCLLHKVSVDGLTGSLRP